MTNKYSERLAAAATAVAAVVGLAAGSAGAVGMLNPVPASTVSTSLGGMPVATCANWKSSSQAEQTAFLVGVANTFAAEAAYWAKNKRPDISAGDAANRVLASTTIADADMRITAWCDGNPDKPNTAVIRIIWSEMIKPKMPAR